MAFTKSDKDVYLEDVNRLLEFNNMQPCRKEGLSRHFSKDTQATNRGTEGGSILSVIRELQFSITVKPCTCTRVAGTAKPGDNKCC